MRERTKATMEEKRENKALTISYARALGYNDNQINCLVTLWTRESRFDHLARPRDSQGKPRSSAFGIAQLLRERSGQPELQILHGLRYLGHRYGGSACRALSHSDRRGWY
jgi:resuscitation-promoting factor RpfB